ncbi:MAG TPA: SRPBCC family protein [Actinomycetota bacterium]|nr:SRPBCC family protein [Actinomycetota bacterium]
MVEQGIRNGRANALEHELVVRVEETSSASPASVYEVLADLRSHAIWAGERQKSTTRLLSVEAPPGPAMVGTEFLTTGADPMGTFADRSIVTEAAPGTALEFVTEAQLTTKKGATVDWTNVHRFELSSDGAGTRITYTIRIVRISRLVGMLGLFKVPGLRELALKASGGVAKRGVRNLARYAEELEG